MSITIIHHNDMDGRCAAAIVLLKSRLVHRPKYPHFIEMDYAKELPLDLISPASEVFIVDFSLKPPVMEQLLARTSNIYWIDHHKTAFEYEDKYSRKIEGRRSNAGAGCELAWEYLLPDKPMPMAVKLVGDYDTWTFKYGEKTERFYYGMQVYDNSPESSIWKTLFEDHVGESILDEVYRKGETCIDFRKLTAEDYAATYGFATEFEGVSCYAVPFYRWGSKLFGERIKQYDICISFAFSGSRWTIGLYSEKIDVGRIAKRYGGGGHTGAAGFVFDAPIVPFSIHGQTPWLNALQKEKSHE